jgi:hypothetical protein
MRGNPADSRVFHVRVEVSEVAPIPARAAAGAPIVLTNPGSAIGGITATPGNRILLNAQADPAENGVYLWSGPSTPMTRAVEADQASELNSALVEVSSGTHAGTKWQQTLAVTAVGFDAQNWQLAAPATRQLRTEVWIEGNAGATDRIAALKAITRPMSQLDASYAPTLKDRVTPQGLPVSACSPGCPGGQICGSDNVCYRPPLQRVQLGFTTSQRTTEQEVRIEDFFALGLP